jgi:uncharacterized FlaG/YvyC family protein
VSQLECQVILTAGSSESTTVSSESTRASSESTTMPSNSTAKSSKSNAESSKSTTNQVNESFVLNVRVKLRFPFEDVIGTIYRILSRFIAAENSRHPLAVALSESGQYSRNCVDL